MKKLNINKRPEVIGPRHIPHPHRNADPRRTWSRSKYTPGRGPKDKAA